MAEVTEITEYAGAGRKLRVKCKLANSKEAVIGPIYTKLWERKNIPSVGESLMIWKEQSSNYAMPNLKELKEHYALSTTKNND